MPDDQEALRKELADIDSQLATLRGESEGVEQQVGGESVGAQDPEDVAAALVNAEENGALIDMLQQRRDSIADRLGNQE